MNQLSGIDLNQLSWISNVKSCDWGDDASISSDWPLAGTVKSEFWLAALNLISEWVGRRTKA
jgi:hypothetical protein